MKILQLVMFTIIIACFSTGCARNACTVKTDPAPGSYTILGKTYTPLKTVHPGFSAEGVASWYGPRYHGRKTSCGEVYNMHALTAAHPTLPMHTLVKVRNLKNKKEVVVRINDRGPFVHDRVIDLSLTAANKIDMVKPGTAPVKVTVLGNSKSMLARDFHCLWNSGPLLNTPNPFFQPAASSKGNPGRT